MKILIIQQKMIGDVLTSSILFEAIKSQYPQYELHYLINSHTYPVVQHNPYIDKFIFYTPEIEQSKVALLKFAHTLRKEKYNVLIDVYSKLSSNLITLFSGAGTKISKYKPYTSLLYHHAIKYDKSSNPKQGLAIINRLQLLMPLNISTEINYSPKIYLTQTEKEQTKAFLESHQINIDKPLIMISILGSGLLKTYPFEYMAKVLDFIVENKKQVQILFNYIPRQIDEAKTIYNLCEHSTQKAIHFDVYGKNLREFLTITSFCNMLIGNEGGAVNMAKALKIPTFAIFSPWIDKATWNLFENKSNMGVHLKDFKPELYTEPEKKYKKNASKYYQELTPELFYQDLKTFLSNN
ncbi:glycosyltransferase family 9 protein [Aestuariivivens insulae]|uniref:glycosyltransferase family 9 protein n=1 Tax=Aestuariivivens insulae TaxID=1621988 RepID=UPI001F59D469|nr:glycosyltransferase family 9 protein [Aestuariivivens insulae]